MKVARTFLVSALFGLVTVGAPHGTVLHGRITPVSNTNSAYNSRFFMDFFSKGNCFDGINFKYSSFTIHIRIHHYIISPLGMLFDWEHQIHIYYLPIGVIFSLSMNSRVFQSMTSNLSYLHTNFSNLRRHRLGNSRVLTWSTVYSNGVNNI